LPNCWSVCWHPAGSLLALAQQPNAERHDWRVIVWDLERRREALRWDVDSAAPPRLAFRPDGRLLAVRSSDGSIRLHSTTDGRELLILEAEGDAFSFLGWRGADDLVTGGDEDDLRVWRLTPDAMLYERTRTPLAAENFCSSRDGRWMTVSFTRNGENRLRLIDRRRGRVETEWAGLGGDVAFTPDSRSLVQCSTTAIAVFEAPTAKE